MTDLSSWKVLLVEDEVDAQEVIIPLLEQHNMSVSTAFTGEDALEILKAERPTFAIVDLSLPRMDGWELLNAMRSDPSLSSIPAVAITAYHSTEVAQEAVAAGFAAYFPKPVNARTFVKDLVSILV